jgi:hypothetical protein
VVREIILSHFHLASASNLSPFNSFPVSPPARHAGWACGSRLARRRGREEIAPRASRSSCEEARSAVLAPSPLSDDLLRAGFSWRQTQSSVCQNEQLCDATGNRGLAGQLALRLEFPFPGTGPTAQARTKLPGSPGSLFCTRCPWASGVATLRFELPSRERSAESGPLTPKTAYFGRPKILIHPHLRLLGPPSPWLTIPDRTINSS